MIVGRRGESGVFSYFWQTFTADVFLFLAQQLRGTTMAELSDPLNLRLVADGTFRLARDGYVLVSVGTISKVRPRGRMLSCRATGGWP